MALVALGIHFFQFGIFHLLLLAGLHNALRHCEYINVQHFTVHHFINYYKFHLLLLVVLKCIHALCLIEF